MTLPHIYLADVSLSPDLTDSVLVNDLYESQKCCSRVELCGITVKLLQGCGNVVLGGKISAEFINS